MENFYNGNDTLNQNYINMQNNQGFYSGETYVLPNNNDMYNEKNMNNTSNYPYDNSFNNENEIFYNNDINYKRKLIEFKNVVKEYKVGEVSTKALNSINLNIYEGDVAIFLGTSGAGKSTALNLLGGLDTVTSGDIIVNGQNIAKFNEKNMLQYRRKEIGFIFQFYNLVQTLSAKDNVALVSEVCKNKSIDAEHLLRMVGLENRMNNFPSQMSGGEQQRVSIARALAKKPKILLADEPTGALDYGTTKQVLELLINVCRSENITLIIVTHNNFIVPIADVIYSFRSGEIISEVRNERPVRVEDLEW